MKHSHAIATGVFVLGVVLGASSPSYAQRACNPTVNQCLSQNLTSSHTQIGGGGSLSSAGVSFSNPGRLDDGTIAEADFNYSFDRSTGRLTLVVINQTTTTASLTALGFNTAPEVTGVQLISATTGAPPGATLTPWQQAFDRDRTDNKIDYPTGSSLKELRMDGFGRFNVFFGNKGIDTGGNGGNTLEIKAGKSVTFVMQVTGDMTKITACSFTSVGSYIPPGSKIVTAVGRFQAGVSGGSAFIGPCEGGSLLVSMAGARATASNSSVDVAWSTASETDTVGFRILRKDLRTQVTVALNDVLIESKGSPVSGADYSFTDSTAVNGKKYAYSIEDWDITGVNTIHDPMIARPNVNNSAIRLLGPSDEARLSAGGRFRWETEGRLKIDVQVAADATFPDGSTVHLKVWSGSSRTLSLSEAQAISGLVAKGTDGGVYWRVVGRDARGQEFTGPTSFLVSGR
ncbi:MAG: hypothetical protein HY049_06405 [Acidobacteria bacterium]|nr:hypothetical protein [Acidobacteriota bacterium]